MLLADTEQPTEPRTQFGISKNLFVADNGSTRPAATSVVFEVCLWVVFEVPAALVLFG